MRAAAAVLGLAALGAAAGCDWRDFDDLKKKTPVVSITAPGDYPAKDEFGAILLPVPPPKDGLAAGRFVATGTHTASVAVVSFDASGGPSGVGVTSADAIQLLQQGPITAIAFNPDSRDVIMGAPTLTFGDVLRMSLDAPHSATEPAKYPVSTFGPTVGEAQYGVGVGAGQIGGGAAAEVVVLSSTTLHVYVDGQVTNDKAHLSGGPTDPCPIDFSSNLPERDRTNRPVIVAGLLATGTQIAVGTPSVAGTGAVSVFDVDLTTGTFTCGAVLTASEPLFGRAMTLVDLDGTDGPDHLLVGAPPNHAYLYSLPLSTGQAPAGTATDSAGGHFGAAVAALNIDGTAGDEMFVGNPDAEVAGKMAAGLVTVYAGAAMTKLPATTFPNPLGEHDPGSGHSYGSGAIAMPFCPTNGGADAGVAVCTSVPLVGSLSKVFTYFTLKKPDPRVR
ncbi:MAG TPA: hypothetical protein VN903_12040 [Polyangia bacterium]|jgi:hypothetical protein|nr:hypothetical protein [Polyangia bacterium]